MKQSLSLPKLIIILVVITLLVSSITGGFFGLLAGSLAQEYILPWINENILARPLKRANQEQKLLIKKVEEESAIIEVVKKVSPAVVSIIVSKDLSKIYGYTRPNIFPFEDFFDFGSPGFQFSLPGAPQGKQEVGGGSGFIISHDGLILTNKHVISDSEAEYTVILNDGQKYEAKVLAQDPINDIAIVKIEAKGLPPVELADSDNLQIGQTVIAIGNALSEYPNTVTKGIISGIGRTITAGGGGSEELIEKAIQTDAAINPGNSGGPLLNLASQVIGINTAISREGQLIGFAIPINEAKAAIDSVKKYGRIIRPFLGVRYILINEVMAKANNLSVDYGALVIRGQGSTELAIIPSSPADKAGLEENDIILEIEDQKIDSSHSLARLLAKYKPEEEVRLKVLHKGKEKIVKVILEERK